MRTGAVFPPRVPTRFGSRPPGPPFSDPTALPADEARDLYAKYLALTAASPFKPDESILSDAFRNPILQRGGALTLGELQAITRWFAPKHRDAALAQANRQRREAVAENLDPQRLASQTQQAFQAFNRGQAGQAITHLRRLNGVDLPLATAILMVFDPERAQPMTPRLWEKMEALASGYALPLPQRRVTDTRHFLSENPGMFAGYMNATRALADRLGVTPLVLNRALWLQAWRERNPDSPA